VVAACRPHAGRTFAPLDARYRLPPNPFGGQPEPVVWTKIKIEFTSNLSIRFDY
jgi:hypothetical protein